ncbi:MAG: hypothetical protein NUV97_03465 [archaeon]|nr:hypothetical protein [archaeon]
MKILYVSVHGSLEWQELQLFTDLGHECFSMGEYIRPDVRPEEAYLHIRPGIQGMIPHPELEKFAIENPATNIPKELLDWCDIVIVMHDPNVIVMNWDKFKASGKPIIWRSIGQSTPVVENMIRRMRYEGLKIVRMSPMEENIIGYLGADAMIRFSVDTEDLNNWNGKTKRVINISQSLLGRRIFCHYDPIMQLMNNFPSMIYGSGNNDLGELNGGELPYDLLKGAMRDSRAFVYGGTFPSPYTLSIIDAMATGIPVICIGTKLAEDLNIAQDDKYHYYEMPNIIKNTENGFISDDIGQLRGYIHELLEDETLAKRVGHEGRKTAIELWDKKTIIKQWKDFFDAI